MRQMSQMNPMNPSKLDLEYFEWLTSQIAVENGKTYNELFERMHNLEFVWTVPNDDNRVADGRELRREFMDEVIHRVKGILSVEQLFNKGVSILEVLVSLSRRVAWIAGGDAPHWAWTLIENLTLERSFDPLTKGKRRRVDDVLDRLVWRTYQRNGFGGFFPLNNPREDQTKVEVWYQMNAFVNEIQE
jgi:hypothetical protein